MFRFLFSGLIWLVLLSGCAKIYLLQSTSSGYLVVRDSLTMPEADSLILPYRRALEQETMQPIIYNPIILQKAQPESALGNLLADLLLQGAKQQFGEVDASMLNYGGIRAGLPADTIRTGSILEMLPFANNLQLVVMDSALLHTFLNHWAQKGGTPVAGLRFDLEDGLATSVLVGGIPLSGNRHYRVVMPDYVANGGDGCGFLRTAIAQLPSGVVLSEVIIEMLKERAISSPVLQTQTDGRIKRR
jgi:2',3'-cyclic-nucleotide 2'-phosphodiesterase (5'-nucleotidase family)